MKKPLSLLLSLGVILSLLLPGCAHRDAPTPEQVELQGEQLKELSRSKVFRVINEPYLSATPVAIEPQNDPVLATRVTLRQKGTIRELATAVSTLTSLSVQVATESDDAPKSAPKASEPSGPGDPLAALLAAPEPFSGRTISVSYDGTLRGLLEHIAAVSGYGWDYKSGAIVLSRFQTKTFTLLAAPGKVSYENQLTNKSKETNTSSGLGSGVTQTVSTADTSTQNAQNNAVELHFDIWKEATEGIKPLLSAQGSVTGNQAAGTITVRDNEARLRQVASYIDEINTRFSRQVALQVQVWALELNDDSEAGLNLQAIFTNSDVSVIAGSLAEGADGFGSASVAVVSGKLKGSQGILKALNQWGNTSVITSGSGIAMNNQPLPIQAIKRHGYLAAVSTTTNTDYGQTAQLTPGEVTTGFAMTVVPHILDKRRVVLQYNVNLSNLDDLIEFSTADVKIQLPQVSTRSFSQRTALKMGQTLVLAGFQQESQQTSNSVGMLSGGRAAGYGKTLLVITIQVESAEI